MNIHNGIKYGGAINAAVAIAMGLDRAESGLERVSETMQPVVDLWSLAEMAYLREEKLCGDGRQIAAGGATTLASYAVINPTASGMLVVIKHFISQISVVADIKLSLDTDSSIAASLGTISNGGFLDTRWTTRLPGGVSRAIVRTGVPVIQLGVKLASYTAAVTPAYEWPQAPGIVLSPGFGIIMQNLDDAALINASAVWTERQALPGELV